MLDLHKKSVKTPLLKAGPLSDTITLGRPKIEKILDRERMVFAASVDFTLIAKGNLEA